MLHFGSKKQYDEKKIALYTPNLYGGGAQRVIVTLANSFSSIGVSTDLVVANFEGPYCKDIKEEVCIVDLEKDRALTSIPSLVKYLRHNEPSSFVSTLMYANIVVSVAHLISGVESKLVLRTSNFTTDSKLKSKSIKDKLFFLSARWAYCYSDRIIALTDKLASNISDKFHIDDSKINTIYNPVDIDRIHELKNEPVDVLRNKSQIILAVGRLSQQKDFSTLLKAFARVRSKGIKAQLVILGEGEGRSSLQTLAASLDVRENISMPGFLENPFAYMSKADLFVLSSQWEGCPNVLIEAMACGTPVVSTNCPTGPDEILEDGKWGELVPVGDEEALAKAIMRTLVNPPVESDQLVERARDFASEKIANQYLDVVASAN